MFNPGRNHTKADLSHHRRRWEEFLALAKKSRAAAEQADVRMGSHLAEVTSFGTNPGNLRMLTYVPRDLPNGAPLVVVLHGCTQTARSYDLGTGWSTVADRYGFALLLPEQRATNNPMQGFNWFEAGDFMRESGEPLSIRQMIEWMVVTHGSDRSRVYVSGLSAGGAMTAVMLATYPEVFAGGAVIAGVPYRCANGVQEGLDCIFQGRSRSPREWGDLVRAASHHQGPWPKISIWHGTGDHTVKPTNAEESIKQWTDVHGLALTPTFESTVDGHSYRVWRGPDGDTLIESHTISGMAHGVPIDPHGEQGCGVAAPFILDMGISSTQHIARSWGLTERLAETSAVPHRPAQISPAGYLAATGSGVDTPAADRSASAQPTQPEPGTHDGGSWAKLDVQEIIATALRAVRPGAIRHGGSPVNTTGGRVPGVDLQKILTTSFGAAGLLQGTGEAFSASGSGTAPTGE